MTSSLIFTYLLHIRKISTPILPLKDENFLIICLCSSSANCWFDINSLLTAPASDFLSKHL